MRRRLNPEIALGFLLATVLWIGALGWQASYAPTDGEKRQCEEAATKSGHKTEECKTLWERTTTDPVAFFTFVLSISTVGLWIVTWQSGKRQSRDMTESIDVAERAFVSGERAWVRVDIELGGPLTFDPSGSARLPLVFTVTNCGKSPATNVRVYQDLLLKYSKQKQVLETYRDFCNRVRTRAEKPSIADFSSYTLFPNETKILRITKWIHSQQITEVSEFWRELSKEPPPPYFSPFMVGCVAYRIPFDDRQHQTGFSVEIRRRVPDAPGELGWGPFKVDESPVHLSDMNVIHSVWGSPSID
jgi:hypothetical protein